MKDIATVISENFKRNITIDKREYNSNFKYVCT